MTTQQMMRLVTVTGELDKLRNECSEQLNNLLSGKLPDGLSDSDSDEKQSAVDGLIAVAAMDVMQLKAALAVLKSEGSV